MATYNGEKYLSDQIDSILNQSYSNWVLFIRDDGSIDKTTEIIAAYSKKHPEKIKSVPASFKLPTLNYDNKNKVLKNFMTCLKYASNNNSFDYFMFSDQDDIWLQNKIKTTLRLARIVEKKKSGPILIHTDLKLVDENLNPIDDSFYAYTKQHIEYNAINYLLFQNHCLGCTMLWNKKLNDIISYNCNDVYIHDWWIALIASCFGTIACLNNSTILYRQHSDNAIGVSKSTNIISYSMEKLKQRSQFKEKIKLYIKQAEVLYKEYNTNLTIQQKKAVLAFIDLKNHKKLYRVLSVIHNELFPHGWIHFLGELLRI